MTKDWRWGWLGILPGIVFGFLIADRIGLFSKAYGWGTVATWTVLAGLFATAILWIVNRRSTRRLNRVGRPVQLLIRPFHAIVEAPEACLTMFGALALTKLILWGQFSHWQASLIISGVWGYMMALAKTAYVGSDDTSS